VAKDPLETHSDISGEGNRPGTKRFKGILIIGTLRSMREGITWSWYQGRSNTIPGRSIMDKEIRWETRGELRGSTEKFNVVEEENFLGVAKAAVSMRRAEPCHQFTHIHRAEPYQQFTLHLTGKVAGERRRLGNRFHLQSGLKGLEQSVNSAKSRIYFLSIKTKILKKKMLNLALTSTLLMYCKMLP